MNHDQPELIAPRVAHTSDREHRLATGVALVQAGTSIREAAEELDLPYTTLQRTYQRLLGPDATKRDEERQRADERMLATAYCAAEQLLGRIATETDQADHRTVTAWTDVTTRVISRLRGWDKGIGESSTGERVADVIDRIAQAGGAKLTLSVEPLHQHQQDHSSDS